LACTYFSDKYKSIYAPLLKERISKPDHILAQYMADHYSPSKNEQRLTQLLNTLPHGVEELDTDGLIIYSNPAHHSMLGYKPGELIGHHIWDFETDDSNKQQLKDYLVYLVSEQPTPSSFVTTNKTKDGREVVVEVVWDYQRNKMGELVGFIAVLSDITERKQAEIELLESERRLVEAQKIASLGHYVYDIRTNQWTNSEVLNDIFGIDESYHRNAESWIEIVHPNSRETMAVYMQDHVIGGLNKFDKTYRIINLTTREERWVHGLGELRFDDDNNPVEMLGTIQDVTERKLAEQKRVILKENAEQSGRKFNAITNQSTEGITVADLDGNYTFVNAAFCNMVGYLEEELLQMTVFEVKAPDQDHSTFARTKGLEEGMSVQVLLQKKDGTVFTSEVIGKVIEFGGKKQVLGTIRDISEQVKAEEQIRTLSLAIEQSPVSVLITDIDANIEYVNSAFENVTGYSAEEVIGLNPRLLNSGNNPSDHYKKLWGAISNGKPWKGEFQNRKKNGEAFWEYAHFAPVVDGSGSIRHYLAVKEDITLRKQQEDKILHQAHFDALTDLPNRFLALDRLSQLLNEAQRDEGIVAVLFLDLDDFKKINDSLGHETGDKLLIEAAARLRNVVRSGDTVGRLGGDEFIVLLGGITDTADAHLTAENLLNRFRDAFSIDGRELILTVSIGIAFFPGDGNSASELLRNADSAMYHSKELGRNTYSYFTETMNRDVSRRLALEEQMHGALSRGEFSVVYQPQIDISNGNIMGTEALLRWFNPAIGQVSPYEFIPVAEQTGLIVQLGQFVLTEVLNATTQWQKSHNPDFRMAVNLSPRQFRDPGLVEFIEDALHQSGVAADSLELEVTEGVLMSGHAYIIDALETLSVLGVSIAMDDFGTGYSSLSYLQNYPFHTLKIDKSFIAGLSRNTADRNLVNAIVAMAHGLNLKVVAEGVETEEQFRFLKDLGCDYAQGYLFSKPVSVDGINELLKKGLTADQPGLDLVNSTS
jgi:diguanylate cyclase (GGDEF)-like protein/PAS domain S-box-containing protein